MNTRQIVQIGNQHILLAPHVETEDIFVVLGGARLLEQDYKGKRTAKGELDFEIFIVPESKIENLTPEPAKPKP